MCACVQSGLYGITLAFPVQMEFTSVNHLAVPSNKLPLPDRSSLCAWNEAYEERA